MTTTLGSRIRACREQAGRTQKDLGSHLHISRSAIAQWESDTTSPSLPTLTELGKLLKTTPEYLAFGIHSDMTRDHKVKRYDNYDTTAVEDLIAMTAANIEDAYLMAGETDYTARDCLDRAADVVLTRYFQGIGTANLSMRSQTT